MPKSGVSAVPPQWGHSTLGPMRRMLKVRSQSQRMMMLCESLASMRIGAPPKIPPCKNLPGRLPRKLIGAAPAGPLEQMPAKIVPRRCDEEADSPKRQPGQEGRRVGKEG